MFAYIYTDEEQKMIENDYKTSYSIEGLIKKILKYWEVI